MRSGNYEKENPDGYLISYQLDYSRDIYNLVVNRYQDITKEANGKQDRPANDWKLFLSGLLSWGGVGIWPAFSDHSILPQDDAHNNRFKIFMVSGELHKEN